MTTDALPPESDEDATCTAVWCGEYLDDDHCARHPTVHAECCADCNRWPESDEAEHA